MYHDRTRIREAWSAFWRDPASGMQCVRGAPDITQAMHGHWSQFAAALPPGARVLDLGCGAGAASGAVVAARPDLEVTGIDFALVPPSRNTRITLVSSMPMEQLSFQDACFDAVASQFGYEYGRTHKTARQLARVLAPEAKFSLIVHHAGSTVVATNRARLAMIRAIYEPDMRAAFLSANAFALDMKLAALLRAHPNDALVQELSRLLPVRVRQRVHQRTLAWTALENALAPERTILEALDACCVDAEELDGWLGPLRQFCAVTTTSILRKPNGDPIAWRIEGVRLPPA
ncbi:MAG TPA: methyltransferase domain-containing protein [Rhizomicrobium sp.]|nr:methyltransferase domain-containing protein [Rhizomicrobium sp.]